MSVKSACRRYFNKSFTVAPVIAIAILTALFTTSAFATDSDREALTKQLNLIIRQIGHRLLLQSGDSTSRVMPVTEVKEGTFQLSFENKFVFNHDSLIALSQGLLPMSNFPSGYTVTVHEGMQADIVYGFEVNNKSEDIACRGRSQPAGRYTIEIAFPRLYKSVAAKNAESSRGPVNFQSDPTLGTTTDQSYSSINLVFYGVLVVLGITVLVGRFGKISKPAPVAKLPSLGKLQFDVEHQLLISGNDVINLTTKECKVLELLNKNFGELITRDTLMQEVWIKEGVITGRSLDMFVSKLRKKLSCDPDLRITNVHGRGYKLEIPASK